MYAPKTFEVFSTGFEPMAFFAAGAVLLQLSYEATQTHLLARKE